jgi:hypothetical protein
VSEVRFASDLDGWMFGPALFATHDGGRSWAQIALSGSVVALEPSGGYVDALVSPCRGVEECTGPLVLEQAPATGGPFVTVLTGQPTESSSDTFSALALHAPDAFVVLSGALHAPATIFATANIADPNGWNAFPDPCASVPSSDLGSMVAPDTSSLYALCVGPGAAGSSDKTIVRTQDGRSTVVGDAPAPGAGGVLAATSSGTLLLAASSGASWLFRSSDGGSTWSTAATYDDGGIGFADLGFATPTVGAVVHGVPGPPTNVTSQLLMTVDAGTSWHAVPIG